MLSLVDLSVLKLPYSGDSPGELGGVIQILPSEILIWGVWVGVPGFAFWLNLIPRPHFEKTCPLLFLAGPSHKHILKRESREVEK